MRKITSFNPMEVPSVGEVRGEGDSRERTREQGLVTGRSLSDFIFIS